MKAEEDRRLFHYDHNGHLVLFRQCVICDVFKPFKYKITHIGARY
jgi:hypothetical protein